MCPEEKTLQFVEVKTKEDQKMALHITAGRRLLRVTSLLLARGASGLMRDKEGRTPLHEVLESPDEVRLPNIVNIVKQLLSVDEMDKNFANLKSNEGTTVLHIAAAKGLGDVMDALISRGARGNVTNKEGYGAFGQNLGGGVKGAL